MRVYFDNAATTPIHPQVVEKMAQVMNDFYGNPSSIHMEGRTARATIETARKKVAELIGASIGEIFFSSGGTESNNTILKCAVRDLGLRRIISSPIEHHSILHCLESLQLNHNIEVIFLDIDYKGIPNLEQLDKLLADQSKKTLVSLMHANNEIGTMIDLEQVGAICEKHQAYFHSDTVQTLGYFPIDVSKIKIHFLSGTAHKFHGPKGTGFHYINSECSLNPFIHGGSQERNMRAGTENTYGIIGLATALEIAYDNLEKEEKHIRSIRQYLINQLRLHFDDIQFLGDHNGRYHYKVLNVSFPSSPKSDLLLLNLDIKGIAASGGSACSSGADAGSHVLSALKADTDRKSIRFSFSAFNTLDEVDYLIEQLKTIIPLKKKVSEVQGQ